MERGSIGNRKGLILAESTAIPTSTGPSSGQNAPPQPGFEGMLIFFVPMIIIFWLLFIRPESKKRKQKEALLGGLKVKDKVVTIGGLYGTVTGLDGDGVILLVDPDKNVKLRLRRSAIDSVIQTEEKK